MALDRVGLQRREGCFKANKPMNYVELSKRMNAPIESVRALSESGMAQVSAALVCAGYDEALPSVMAWLLKHDGEWKRNGPGRPPKDHIEYLKWHRARDVERQRQAEIKRAAKARAEATAEERRREDAHIDLEIKWRERDVARVTPTMIPDGCRLTPAERRANLIAYRARVRAKRLNQRAKRRCRSVMAEIEIERKALELLDHVCQILGADRSRVTGQGRTPFLVYVRQVYAMVARDTSYCGAQPSYPLVAEALGRPTTHSTAMMSYRRGLLNYESVLAVGNICRALKLDPPSYAKQGEA
jgi:hypothetical protein